MTEANDPNKGRRSPMIEEINRREGQRGSVSRKALAVLAVLGAVAGGVVSVLRGDSGSASAEDVQAEVDFAFPGESDLDRLDREHDEAMELSPEMQILGDVDGCVLLTEKEQLLSVLCCSGASISAGKNPEDCPRPRIGDDVGGLPLKGGRAVVLDPRSAGVDSTSQ